MGDGIRHVYIVGCKGIPARYGGFETFVEKLTENRASDRIRYHVACAVDEMPVYCQALADKIGVMISTLSAFCVPTAFPTSEICQA